jgi:exosortase A-associated hydrolase 2
MNPVRGKLGFAEIEHLRYKAMPLPISFFLPGAAGHLFSVYYPPADSAGAAKDALYVHPFANEMFASRNVIAALCRKLAGCGFGVLTVDLYGCGDSGGDFGEARWEVWREDLSIAVRWLRERGREQLSLWGLRLGALLAMDFAAQSRDSYRKLILWQPILSGEAMLNQFLRMNADETYCGNPVTQLTEQRKSLLPRQRIEVAGYELASELVRSMDRVRLAPLGKLVRAPIHWTEMGNKGYGPMQSDSLQVFRQWQEQGVTVSTYKMSSTPFWLSAHSIDAACLVPHLQRMFGDADHE